MKRAAEMGSNYLTLAPLTNCAGKGVRESAGINRLGIENERVLQRKPSQ